MELRMKIPYNINNFGKSLTSNNTITGFKKASNNHSKTNYSIRYSKTISIRLLVQSFLLFLKNDNFINDNNNIVKIIPVFGRRE